MKIIVAPDSFKGSLSAPELCCVIKQGILRVLPDAEVIEIPLADGGEGTMQNLIHATSGMIHSTEADDPLGRPRMASYGVLGDNETVVVEMAQASGLPLLTDEERNPLLASSYGTGQLIKAALDKGFRRFIIGLGGSATNDAGMGMLRALGMEFYDEKHNPIPEGGGALSKLLYIDEQHIDQRIYESTFIVASDVTNPLCGMEGASSVFGPQKGATPEMVALLDANLHHLAEVVKKQKAIDLQSISGGGAAGGLGAALVAFLGARIESGIDIFLNEVNFKNKIKAADLIITGEGKLDQQTLSGKVVMGVGRMAKGIGVPVIALCGQLALSHRELKELGVLSAFSIIKEPCSLEKAFQHTPDWVTDQIENIVEVMFYNDTKPDKSREQV
ncbi:glycerate kinase [Bacillus alkalicellulosilyticus]|uniref:glycerate kinase n=1 Tax=Alkalihalobacterium alkalicellulosilyticum TaxID=1912214 RepID=UPI000996C29C|nr:glycerate kinase [Bacillus alkalicellulosilyticus]